MSRIEDKKSLDSEWFKLDVSMALKSAIDAYLDEKDPDEEIFPPWQRCALGEECSATLDDRVCALAEEVERFSEEETLVYDDINVAGILGLDSCEDEELEELYEEAGIESGEENVTCDFLEGWIIELKLMIDVYNDQFADEVLKKFDNGSCHPSFYFPVMFNKYRREDHETTQKYVLEGLSEITDFDGLLLLARVVSQIDDYKELGQKVLEEAKKKASSDDELESLASAFPEI